MKAFCFPLLHITTLIRIKRTEKGGRSPGDLGFALGERCFLQHRSFFTMQATVEMKVVIERSRRLLFSGLRFFRSLPMSRSETWRSSSQARASLSGCGVGRASNGILYFRLDWSYRNRSCISNKQLPWAPDRRRFHSTSIGSDGRILEDNLHPLRDHHISSSAWFVLKRLHASNHLVYLVGGAVRDILLGKQPKDFDVLTSAEPEEVLQCFPGMLHLSHSHTILSHIFSCVRI